MTRPIRAGKDSLARSPGSETEKIGNHADDLILESLIDMSSKVHDNVQKYGMINMQAVVIGLH